MPEAGAPDVVQIANPTLHDDMCHTMELHGVEHVEQLDDVTPSSVIIETRDALYFMLLMPCVGRSHVFHLLEREKRN